ncbi:dead end protein homolog 1-like isoform X2 [Anopheles merus]|uniref:RRM domain-containing protein n=2 Tax=Anopheles merus TaxID=30066 RepID=A0A182V053_ANOME|nr:dead end protein homolog 1-like isoform X2 [Anopheles merus]XP_041760555.1 dead end protein homolog 1-like isoform X2 [Anopheles merus]XP_041760556.1 dead end protein homolog 1-like isoform X2 [Anopheles merus]
MPVTWMGNTYVIQHNNGQCIIALKSRMSEALPFNELYVKGIPRNFGPEELVPIFSNAGVVHTIRLLMDFGQHNRGFAYVSYVDPRHIDRALVTLHGMQISVTQRLEVSKSRNSRSLQLCNLQNHRTAAIISQTVAHITRIREFRCKMIRLGETNDVTIIFKSHHDYIHAYTKLNRVRHIFGPTCCIKTF